MEKEMLFDTLKNQSKSFFEKFDLHYSFKEEYIKVDETIKGRHYKTYSQVWSNLSSILEVRFKITFYLDSDSKSLINIYIDKYKRVDVLELEKWMNVGDYMKNKKNNPILRLEDYSGTTIDEKIDSFFSWLEENIDKKLISVLKGNRWIDTPFDWGRYK